MTLPLYLSWWRGLDLNQRPPGRGAETVGDSTEAEIIFVETPE